jgi:DNA-binding XRE family transcriptional regulator
MSGNRESFSRKELAARLGVSKETIRQAEKFLGLDEAKIQVNRRVIRYLSARLRRREWFRRLGDE